jgi:hypothetical protein
MDAGQDFGAEVATFEAGLPRWLPAERGRYVSIVGTEVLGFFDDAGDAWRAGLPRRPEGNIFVREVLPGPQFVMLPMMVR